MNAGSTRNRVRAALLSAGGVPAAGAPQTYTGQPIQNPFGTAEPVEHPALRALPLGGPAPAPANLAFLDGIQRHAVDGHFGITPVVRGYVAAGVLTRQGRALGSATRREEEFLVVPGSRLTAHERAELERAGLPIFESEADPRPHPLMDVQAAGVVVERRREDAERQVALAYVMADPSAWLVVDGALTGLPLPAEITRVIGVIKSHETQFLDGADLKTALTLPAGHRTSVFARTTDGGRRVFTWYLRLWPWDGAGLLHGLVRVERPAVDAAVTEADMVSQWLLAERAPLAAPDARWDRLLYPIHEVEEYLRARAGAWR